MINLMDNLLTRRCVYINPWAFLGIEYLRKSIKAVAGMFAQFRFPYYFDLVAGVLLDYSLFIPNTPDLLLLSGWNELN